MPQERGKGSFCGHSCSSPTHTAASSSLLFVNFPMTMKHLTYLLCQPGILPSAQTAGVRKGVSHSWAHQDTKKASRTSHCESASPVERLEMPSPITLESFTSNTRLHCLLTLKIPLLPLPFHIQNQLQTGGIV